MTPANLVPRGALLGLLVLLALPAEAAPIFEETRTGAELFADADVAFPTDAPTLGGDALDLVNTADAQILLRWSLLPADAARGELLIRTTLDYTRITTQTGDNDPLIGIAGGDLFLGVSRQNNAGGQVGTVRKTITDPTALGGSSGPIFLTSLDPLEPFTFDLRSDLPAITFYEEGEDSASGEFAPTGTTFDAQGPIDFILGTGGVSVGEGFRIHSVSVAITPLPEPGAMALVAALAGGLAFRSARRPGG